MALRELSGSYLAQLEASVATAFERSVALHSVSVAVATETESLTYEALNLAANRLAHAILARCGERDQPVAFIDGGGTTPYVCLLAILKAGKPYIAFDPSQPFPQLRAACGNIEPALILATSRQSALAAQLAGEARNWLDLDEVDAASPAHNPRLDIPASRPAALFFTAGSTGLPKAVYYDQRSLLHRIFTTVLCTDTRPADRQALYILCDRTWSATIIFATLLVGATLCPFDIKAMGVLRMAEWVARERVTHFSLTPSLFRQWMDVLPTADEGRYPALRLLGVGAEALSRQDGELFKRHFSPQCVLFHSLAMSECGRIAYTIIRRETSFDDDRIAVGRADLDKEILICGEDGHWVEPGETGEIAVRTHYMMSGYWNKPELTAAVIRPDPEGSDKRIFFTGDIGRLGRDGRLEVLGRRDFQVKVRGYRVQPAEVEQRLFEFGSIKEAVVVALDGPDGDKRLVAYLVAPSASQPSITDLRVALAKTLPDHAIPSAFVFLPTLPLSPGGKVDRRALPPPSLTRPQLSNPYVAPRSGLEAQLVRIWEEVLPVAPVGVHDNFFDLGGDSLGASQLIARVMRDLEVTLSPRELYECASVGAMAALLVAMQATPPKNRSINHARRTPARTKR